MGVSFAEVLTEWSDLVTVRNTRRFQGWCVCSRMAEAMALGALPFDMIFVSPRHQHETVRHGHPSKSLLRSYLQHCKAHLVGPDTIGQGNDCEVDPVTVDYPQGLLPLRGGRCTLTVWHPLHMLAALWSTKSNKATPKDLAGDVLAHLKFAFPRQYTEMRQALAAAGFAAPSRKSLQRGRCRLDVVAMLIARRRNNEAKGALARSSCFDASPQHGSETFATNERVCRQEGAPPAEHRLPILGLGYGCTSALHKACALLWALFWEHGPLKSNARRCLNSIVSIVTDMGGEFGVANLPDILDLWWAITFEEDVATIAYDPNTWLFAAALQVPGWNHLCDGLLKSFCTGLKFMAEYTRLSRQLCRWLRKTTHREQLMNRGKCLSCPRSKSTL